MGNDIQVSGYKPGAIGKITELHGTYYSQHWNFGLYFESKVAMEMSEFLNRFDNSRDGFWLASIDHQIVGSVTIDGIHSDKEGAHLRWFIVDTGYHGKGVGNRLIQEAVVFCKTKLYGKIYLWTFGGLDPARHLYEKHGFKMCEEFDGQQWGVTVKEQRFELNL